MRVAAAQDANSGEILAFNNKAKASLLKLQKEMEGLGAEASVFSNFAKTSVVKNIDDLNSSLAIRHSMSFKSGVEKVVYPPDKDGNLLSPGGRLIVKPKGVIFEIFVSDRPLPIVLLWRKDVSIGGKEVTIGYNLELGSDLAFLNEKISKLVQDTVTKELLP